MHTSIQPLIPDPPPISNTSPSAFSNAGITYTPAVVAYADGSALGNPGPAGWAVIIVDTDDTKRTLSGSLPHTTCNRAELTAATQAMLAVPAEAKLELHLDSEYVVKGATVWRYDWQCNGWRTTSRRPVANKDLWERLFAAHDARTGKTTFNWVRGHAGNALNEAVDKLARAEAERAKLALDAADDDLPFGRGAD